MAAPTQTEEGVTLKLLVNKDTNKVLFAEAEKDFADVLFSFLTLPLGTIARLVEKESSMGSITLGCLNSLYHCVEDLDEGCLGTSIRKEMLFQPANSSEDYCSSLKLNIDDTEPTKYLVISPLSPTTLLYLLNRFETSIDDLKEKVVVTIGLKECLGILKAALTSTSALSNGLAHLLTEVKQETCE